MILCVHNNNCTTCPICLHNMQVTQIERQQQQYAAMSSCITDYINKPSTENVAISKIVEVCWHMIPVQAYLENAPDRMARAAAIRLVITNAIKAYINSKEPNVNRRRHDDI